MRPLGVVVVELACRDRAGLTDGKEQQLVAPMPVEAPDEPVPRRLARHNMMPFGAGISRPGSTTFEAVRWRYHGYHHRPATFDDRIGQPEHDPPAQDRPVDHRPNTLACHVVDNVEHAEPPAGEGLVLRGGQAPTLVEEHQHRHRRPPPTARLRPFRRRLSALLAVESRLIVMPSRRGRICKPSSQVDEETRGARPQRFPIRKHELQGQFLFESTNGVRGFAPERT